MDTKQANERAANMRYSVSILVGTTWVTVVKNCINLRHAVIIGNKFVRLGCQTKIIY